MDIDDIARWQEEGEWDFDSAQRLRVPRGNRAVVAVAFTVTDFTLVSDAAERRGQTITQFIHDAALGRALGSDVEGAQS